MVLGSRSRLRGASKEREEGRDNAIDDDESFRNYLVSILIRLIRLILLSRVPQSAEGVGYYTSNMLIRSCH